MGSSQAVKFTTYEDQAALFFAEVDAIRKEHGDV
jgi:hypothetical protein